MPAMPLPDGNNAAETIRRLRAIDAEFFGTIKGSTIIGSDIYSSNWDGAIPANLSTPDTTVTTGYYIDADIGSMQLAGSLWLASTNATIHVGNPGSGAVLQIGIGGTTGGLGWESSFPSPLEAPSVRGPFFGVNIDGDVLGTYPADSNQYIELVSAQWAGNDEVWMRLNADNWTTGSNPYFQVGIGTRANGIFAVQNDGVTITQPLLTDSGSAAAPSRTFSSDIDTGDFLLAAGQLGFASGGNLAFTMLRSGDSNRLIFGNSTNDYIDFDDVTNIFKMVINGNTEFYVSPTVTRSLNIYNLTNAAAANVYVNSSGTLYRSTSARKYKKKIRKAGWLASINLDPVSYVSRIDGTKHYGLIADDITSQLSEAGIYGDNGEVEDYDTRAIIAILAAKVQQLEENQCSHSM